MHHEGVIWAPARFHGYEGVALLEDRRLSMWERIGVKLFHHQDPRLVGFFRKEAFE